MIDKIRIRNYKSLLDTSIDLQLVNLLIGANNSGKSNFLKALEFFGKMFNGQDIHEDFKSLSYRNSNEDHTKSLEMISKIDKNIYRHINYFVYDLEGLNIKNEIKQLYKFVLADNRDNAFSRDEDLSHFRELFNHFDNLFLYQRCKQNNQTKINLEIDQAIDDEIYESKGQILKKINRNKFRGNSAPEYPSKIQNNLINVIKPILSNIKIYKPDQSHLFTPAEIKPDVLKAELNADVSNLVLYLDNLIGENPELREEMEDKLTKFDTGFKGIRLQYVGKTNFKRLGLKDIYDRIFWGDEISEGLLYFLCILAVIHQPNPPKLLLLEEPESSIHPRRISEVIRLIKDMAHEKDIQVIMTTHSPIVLDQFSDDPESVHIFEMEKGETKIKNLKKDVIDKTNKKFKDKGFSEMDLKDSLGDHWTVGLLGGVPDAID